LISSATIAIFIIEKFKNLLKLSGATWCGKSSIQNVEDIGLVAQRGASQVGFKIRQPFKNQPEETCSWQAYLGARSINGRKLVIGR
jgi:hypothetical protein